MAQDFDVIFEVAQVPSDFCPSTVQEIYEGLIKYSRFTLPGGDTVSLVNFGANEPSFNNRNKPWVRTTVDGKPLGTFVFFNGRWVKAYNYELGQIVSFAGARTDLDALGPFAFCDGDNATPNLVSKMEPSNATADEYDYALYMFTGYNT